ncbi:hypothetical protein KFU94_69910 [Chloroflexi bacterium TSY]|nr:hypothetical protein [Chloroflexi bacterium TSY]
MSLALTGQDQLTVVDGPMNGHLEVIRQADGTIGWLRFGSRIHRRQ